MMNKGQMTELADVVLFLTSGKATFTLVSKETGTRFTYKAEVPKPENLRFVRKPGDPLPIFVSLLRGADNDSDFMFVGTLWRDTDGSFKRFNPGRKTNVLAKSFLAIDWFFRRIALQGNPLNHVEFWHEGRCGMCGRKLTVPESIETGLGPVCAQRMGAAHGSSVMGGVGLFWLLEDYDVVISEGQTGGGCHIHIGYGANVEPDQNQCLYDRRVPQSYWVVYDRLLQVVEECNAHKFNLEESIQAINLELDSVEEL